MSEKSIDQKTAKEILAILLRIKSIFDRQIPEILKKITVLLANRLSPDRLEDLAEQILRSLEKIEKEQEQKEREKHIYPLLAFQQEQIALFEVLQKLITQLEQDPLKKKNINKVIIEICRSINSEEKKLAEYVKK